MNVLIVNNEKVIWEGTGEKVFLPLDGGDVMVMDHHSPIVGVLKPGTLTVYGPDEFSLEVSRGVVKVKDNSLDVFIR